MNRHPSIIRGCRPVEPLEARFCLSAIVFIESNIDRIESVQTLDMDVHAADIDGDGDLDVLSVHANELFWYENTDGKGIFGSQQPIKGSADNQLSFDAADLDNDGDVDILAGQIDEIAWYENTDGTGNFELEHQVATGLVRANSVKARDLDGDDDLDILVGSQSDGIVWYENTDGTGSFERRSMITDGRDRIDSLQVADLDGDSDLDVIAANQQGTFWHENLDGVGTFGEQRTINSPPWSHNEYIHASDFDTDGDVDVLSAWKTWDVIPTGGVAWHENTDGAGNFRETHLITEPLFPTWSSLSPYAVDLDRDSDIDVLFSSPGDGWIGWFENLDGKGTFSGLERIKHVMEHQILPLPVFPADSDGDGDLDVIYFSGSDKTLGWYENRLIGDVNNDGIFNSRDLVNVFQIGKYEDDLSNNATFDDGDWNGDGDFDSNDLVEAFQAGHYATESQRVKRHTIAASDVAFDRDDTANRTRTLTSF